MPSSDSRDELRRDAVDAAAEHLRCAYPSMFSASSRCLRPHLNVDTLRNTLYKSEVCGGSEDWKRIAAWMARCNERLGADARRWKSARKKSKAVEKAEKNGFWLGMSEEWHGWTEEEEEAEEVKVVAKRKARVKKTKVKDVKDVKE